MNPSLIDFIFARLFIYLLLANCFLVFFLKGQSNLTLERLCRRFSNREQLITSWKQIGGDLTGKTVETCSYGFSSSTVIKCS